MQPKVSDSARQRARPPTREEIVARFRACAAANGGATPGRDRFLKLSGIGDAQVYRHFWRGGYAELAHAADLTPNRVKTRLSDDLVFSDYAKICLRLGCVPNTRQIPGAQREFGMRSRSVERNFAGGFADFQQQFRLWLDTQPPELQAIRDFAGWRDSKCRKAGASSAAPSHPFLPAVLQHLDNIARGKRPPGDSGDAQVATLFERRVADAFRCLGFEVRALGQGRGRNADALALAPRERFALIVDAKMRAKDYALGTEDRKFLEYAVRHGRALQRRGFERIYFTLVGPAFKEPDLRKLTEALASAPIRSVALITAEALMRLVEDSIRDRTRFSLADLERQIFSRKLISG